MIKYEDYVFMFGGIQDVTKEKNDIYIFQLSKNQWSKIHTTTNSIYDCSPTLKRNEKVPSYSFSEIKAHKTQRRISFHLKNQTEEWKKF